MAAAEEISAVCLWEKRRPAAAHLIVRAEVFVLLHHLQLSAPPHQNGLHPATRQVGVQLGSEYIDSPQRQSLEELNRLSGSNAEQNSGACESRTRRRAGGLVLTHLYYK